LAADLTLSGRKINLFELPEFWDSLAPVKDTGEIKLGGVGRCGTARLETVTSDIHEALADAWVVLVSVPAFGAERMAEACAPAALAAAPEKEVSARRIGNMVSRQPRTSED
jgi:hypothetical protein